MPAHSQSAHSPLFDLAEDVRSEHARQDAALLESFERLLDHHDATDELRVPATFFDDLDEVCRAPMLDVLPVGPFLRG